MPLYLIRKEFAYRPTTRLLAPVEVVEYAVQAPSLRQAAIQVMDLKPGKVPGHIKLRHTREPYTGAYIDPPQGCYAGIVDIVEGRPETLPKAKPLIGVPEAARAVFERNIELAGLEDTSLPRIAIYHALNAVIDYSAIVGTTLDEIVHDILVDYESITGEKAPSIVVPGEFGVVNGADPAVGAALVDVNADVLGIDTEGDPNIGLFHLVLTLMNHAETNDVDFQGLVDMIVEDRPMSTPTMSA